MAINNLRLRCQFSRTSGQLVGNRTMGTDSDRARASFHTEPSYPKEPCPGMGRFDHAPRSEGSFPIASVNGSI
jgi:hypothetical protein